MQRVREACGGRSKGPLHRVFKNAGLLFAGQIAAGIFGLGAFALAARALGTETFGVLILIHAYRLAIATIVRFNAWYAVIRYGTACLNEGRRRDLQGLLQFTGLLDLSGAVTGAVAAAAAAPVVGPWVGWPSDAIALGQLYSLSIVVNAVDTPTGILRLFDRFDIIAWLRLASPMCRCLGAVAAYAVAADLRAFLAIWFLAVVVDSALLWGFAVRELMRRGCLADMSLRLRGVTAPHAGIWRLVWSTNLNSTLGVVFGRLTTLVLGSVLGPAGAGLYHVAAQFAAVFDRPVEMLRRTIYPELAQLSAGKKLAAMRHLAIRSILLVAAVVVPLVIVVTLFAQPLLRFSVGDSYIAASIVLSWLMVRQAILALGFPLGLMLVSLDRATSLLKVNLATGVFYMAVLIGALSLWGLGGAGFAASAAALVAVLLNLAAVVKVFRRGASAGTA